MAGPDFDRRGFLKVMGLATASAWALGCRGPGAAGQTASQAAPGYPVQPVPFTDVQVADAFWTPRIETNRTVTIPFAFEKCEETGRIDNFAIAGGLQEGDFRGKRYDDSDVFKVVEGAAYSLSLHPDPALEAYLDDLISKIAAAQEDDGYLYTTRTINPERPVDTSPGRWSDLAHGHELYNVGHLYEAAVAHYRATGERSLLDVALKNADLITRVFGPDGKQGVPGHQEVEIGLVKLYLVTGKTQYLNLARFFLDERGRARGRALYGAYSQDHKPVVEQREAVGHAVRAGYMYSGMADVAALTGSEAYVEAIDRIWEGVVSRKLYLTGGLGARREGEAFGADYELPNATAYSETCAAVANMLWNHRLFLLHSDARYIDVLERVLYNGFLAGVSMDGDTFFYPNPLASDGATPFNHGAATRQPWFGTSCCPTNVARFLPSLPGYVYAQQGDRLYVNLFVAGRATVRMEGAAVHLTQDTRYPWEGAIRISVEPDRPRRFALYVRIPGWARNRPVPSGLYRYLTGEENVRLSVNGKPAPVDLERGFARLRRRWRPGDVVELYLPMPVRRVVSHAAVRDNAGRVALERGPVVYCAEGIDNGGHVRNLVLPDEAVFRSEHRADLLGGVTVLHGRALGLYRSGDGGPGVQREQAFVAVPYYAWAHRGAGEMAVWLPRDASLAEPV